jgi:anti-sigma B factor antagonist
VAVSAEITSRSVLDLQGDSSGSREQTVVFRGELDLTDATVMEALLRRLCSDGVRSVLLDLSGLTFIDSTGVYVVLAAQRLCREHGCQLLIRPGDRCVQRVFELTGLLDTLPFQASDEKAASAAAHA